jgi:hypothetical protein
MRFEELRFVCEEAAKELVARDERPVPATIVLPGPASTRLLRLSDFPINDGDRRAYLATFAHDHLVTDGIPAWGFLVEGEVDDQDVVVIVFGARKHAPRITAAPITGDGTLEAALPDEELDPTAMPFLHPLQRAVDSLPAEPPDDAAGPTLPLHP